MDDCATANMMILDFGKAFDFVNQYMQGPLSFFYHRYSSVFLRFRKRQAQSCRRNVHSLKLQGQMYFKQINTSRKHASALHAS